jgi:hypothetical protein
MDCDNEDRIPHSKLAFTVLASVDAHPTTPTLFFKALMEQKSSNEKPTPCQEKANQVVKRNFLIYDCCTHQLRFGVPPPECPKRQ